jgi:hypothetical protein
LGLKPETVFLTLIVTQIEQFEKMSELLQSIVVHLRKEIDKPEWKQKVIEPVIKWILHSMWPYAIGMICLNFFTTIAAVSLVLYVYHKNLRIS